MKYKLGSNNSSFFKYQFMRKKIKMGIFFICVGFMGEKSYGGEQIAYWAGSYIFSCMPETVQQTAKAVKNFTVGKPKTYPELFKEFVFNREVTKLNDLVIAKVESIEQELYKKFPISISGTLNTRYFSVKECRDLLDKADKSLKSYALAILRLDYVDAIKRELDNAYTAVEKLDVESVGSSNKLDNDIRILWKKETLDFLEKMKRNLCAELYVSYEYDREGGAWDRHSRHEEVGKARKKYWKFRDNSESIPTPTRNEISETMKNVLETDNAISAILYNQSGEFDLLRKYKETIEFIQKLECDIIGPEIKDGLNSYRQQYQKFFKFSATEIKYNADFISTYYDFIDHYEKQYPSKSVPIRINQRQTRSSHEGGDSVNSSSYPQYHSPEQTESFSVFLQKKSSSQSPSETPSQSGSVSESSSSESPPKQQNLSPKRYIIDDYKGEQKQQRKEERKKVNESIEEIESKKLVLQEEKKRINEQNSSSHEEKKPAEKRSLEDSSEQISSEHLSDEETNSLEESKSLEGTNSQEESSEETSS